MERSFHDTCILQTKFGLKKYLWARWIASDIAQVHDGERVIAELIQTSPHDASRWEVHVYDQSKPITRWSRQYTRYRNTREDLGWARLIREAVKSWKLANPETGAAP